MTSLWVFPDSLNAEIMHACVTDVVLRSTLRGFSECNLWYFMKAINGPNKQPET